VREKLLVRRPGEGENVAAAEPDEYHYDRLIRTLVEQGFGSWQEAAAADLIDAAIFVYLGHDATRIAEEWMKS